jgi:hypothetical protein
VDEAKEMLKTIGLFASDWNNQATGIPHVYEGRDLAGGKVVVDHMTGLMWQQGGSPNPMKHDEATKYIRTLNNQKFAGYHDWRLPTLDEAMSLMEPTKKNGELYIDPVFDKSQRWIWTTDKSSAGVAWVVFFSGGYCNYTSVYYGGYVRGVRSGQSNI